MAVTNSDPSQIINSDSTRELLQARSSMSTSSYATSTLVNRDEQKETNSSLENLSSPLPSVVTRLGKAAIGPRVLPALDPNGDAPPVRLKHFPIEKKGIFIMKDVYNLMLYYSLFLKESIILIDIYETYVGRFQSRVHRVPNCSI